jgi:nicotinamide-nucleotide amidase
MLRDLLSGPPVLTLAAAESMTCGRVQAAIGAVSGASAYFLGGITTYTLAQKVRQLGVDATAADRDNGVSADVAAQMAVGACRLFGSDLAVATTGYAEPNAGRGFAEPGAFWAVARGGGDGGNMRVVRHGFFQGHGLDRVAMQTAVADEVLGALVEYVQLVRAAERTSKFA